MRVYTFLFLAIFLVSCAPIRVNYDFEKGTNFDQYKTYNYYSEMQTGLSDLDTKRFLDALDAKMTAKGFALSDTPDFFVDIKSSQYQEAQRNNVGVGLGGGGGHVGGGISIGLPIGQANVNRQITIDFVDENKKQLFWQAVSESSFNPKSTPEKREQLFNTIAEKVLTQYPPKK
ncbi:DUF4136 domain-containing protein [Mariniflexile litorale]|uniref:DUF4136 domain-containing protein n=1 Tax=Mariniflexile litorale TaxID=3045158 RepID=A0AAU7EBN7_9FLAO|nr:DUF4136 domain-containing protein [Mariniflexile sp. KMM 9835]MDQ8213414.1 DUF4136 domain-containing protein [Mariniflexile sp. KMM 9835]